MEDIKTFLFYLIGLAGLIGASLLFANQGEPPEIIPFPTRVSQPPTRASDSQTDTCAAAAQGIFFNKIPSLSTITNSTYDRLSISGTIYASDGITPFSGALIEVWQEMPLDESQSYLHPIPIQETNGHYTFTMVNPRPGHTIRVHYQVSYQHRCLLLMSLKIISVSLLRQPFSRDIHPSFPMSSQSPAAQFREAGPVFHGPIDVVLPVSPPTR